LDQSGRKWHNKKRDRGQIEREIERGKVRERDRVVGWRWSILVVVLCVLADSDYT
jgi:hypothetical protein